MAEYQLQLAIHHNHINILPIVESRKTNANERGELQVENEPHHMMLDSMDASRMDSNIGHDDDSLASGPNHGSNRMSFYNCQPLWWHHSYTE